MIFYEKLKVSEYLEVQNKANKISEIIICNDSCKDVTGFLYNSINWILCTNLVSSMERYEQDGGTVIQKNQDDL